jgi:hypothetical protein
MVLLEWLSDNPWLGATLIGAVGYVVEGRSKLEAVSYASIFSLGMIGYQNTWANFRAPFCTFCVLYLWLRLKATGRRVTDPESIGDQYRENTSSEMPPGAYRGTITPGDGYHAPPGSRVDVLRCRIGGQDVADNEQEGYAVLRTKESNIKYNGDIFTPAKGCSYEVLWVISDWRVAEHFPEHAGDGELEIGWLEGPLKMEVMSLWRRVDPPRPTIPEKDVEVMASHKTFEDELEDDQELMVREWIEAQQAVVDAAKAAPKQRKQQAARAS